MQTPEADPQTTSSAVDQAVAWFARLRSEPISPEERQAFEVWRRQSSAHVQAYDEICGLWNDPVLKAAAVEAARRPALIARHAGGELTARRWVFRFAAAASIAGLLVTVGWQLDLPLRLTADHLTSTGEQRLIQLPDQSSITLNTQSAIATEFDAESRRIHLLKGEASFHVRANAQRPFIVDHQNIFTRAVGTEFLVREEADGIRVTVVEGVVELEPQWPDWSPIRLTAGQQVTVNAHGPSAPHEIDIRATTAWLRGRLVFDNVRLTDVVDELRRYHSGVIMLWNPAVADVRVSGSYTLTDPAGILTALAQTLPIRTARISDRVVLLF